MMPPQAFENVVREAFRGVATEYGLMHIETKEHLPEIWVRFENRTTGVVVGFEFGSVPWLDITRLERSGAIAADTDRSSLELLLAERAPEAVAQDEQPITRLDDPRLRELLDRRAADLRRWGSDVLSGDFRIFGRLHQLAEENLKRRNKELFGTETGETK